MFSSRWPFATSSHTSSGAQPGLVRHFNLGRTAQLFPLQLQIRIVVPDGADHFGKDSNDPVTRTGINV